MLKPWGAQLTSPPRCGIMEPDITARGESLMSPAPRETMLMGGWVVVRRGYHYTRRCR